MEAAGLAIGVVGLAGLFTSCLDCLERLESYRGFPDDSKALETIFNAEKVSFHRWGREVGFTEGKLAHHHHPALDDPDVVSAAHELLKIIVTIFQREAGDDTGISERDESRKDTTRRQKVAWALWGRNRREEQVHLFAALVRKLHELVPLNTGDGGTDKSKDQQSIELSDETENKSDLLQDVKEFLSRREEERRAELRRELQSWLLGSYSPNELYRESTRKRLDGTCDWLLERPEFKKWQFEDTAEGLANILWITGPAGFGKTVLFARILEYLSETSNSPTAYYFFSSDFESRSEPIITIRCWISQLIMRDARAFDVVYSSWLVEEDRTVSYGVLENLFEDVLRALPGCVVALDGLDECTNPAPLLELISETAKKTKTRVLVTSRGEPEIRHALEERLPDGFVEYRITIEDVRNDTESYSNSLVNERLSNKTEEVKSDIAKRMTEQCDGQFLWLRMQAKCLRKGLNLKQLQRAVSETPTGLEHLYERNWATIMSHRPREKNRAIELLRWATFALRPLNIGEITEAVLIDDGLHKLPHDELPDTVDDDYINSEIMDLCGSLVEIRPNCSQNEIASLATLHITHFSVKQYLLLRLSGSGATIYTNKNLLISYEVQENVSLAKKCIEYMSFGGIWEPVEEQTSSGLGTSFLNYAAHSWHRHAKLGPSTDQDLGDRILEFIRCTSGNWIAWTQWYDCHENMVAEGIRTKDPSNPLYYSAKIGLETTLNQLLELDLGQINEIGSCGRTPLTVACALGYLSIVKALFAAGARIEVNHKHINPVYEAALNGRTDVMEFLLSKNPRMVKNQWGWAPLHASAHSGHAAIVKLLIEYGVDLDAKNTDQYTPLHLASRGGHINVVQLLLGEIVDLEARTNYQYTALHQAAKKGHLEIVKLLFAAGANIETLSQDGWSPLNSAAEAGHFETTKFLLEKGVSLETQTQKGWTPLRSSIEKGRSTDLLRLLLKKGADLNSRSKEGWTPLMAASLHGREEIAKLLIEEGADIKATSAVGWTSLHHAATNGSLETVRILLDKGASLDSLSKRLQQPIHCAAKEGHVKIVRELIDHGAKINPVDYDNWTPLHRAVQFNHLQTIELLLENGADIEATTRHGLSPLYLALAKSDCQVIDYLLMKGASIAAPSFKGESVVHLSARRTDPSIMKLFMNTIVEKEMKQPFPASLSANSGLEEARRRISKSVLDRPINATSSKSYSWTPLHLAARLGHFEVAQYLVNQNVELDVATDSLWRPLHFAARYNHPDIATMLLAHGADIAAVTKKENTPLHLAALGGSLGVAQLLIENGAAADVFNCNHWTPLHQAARYGFADIVDLLLRNRADMKLLTDNTTTPLWLAIHGGHVEILKQLILKGHAADPDTVDSITLNPSTSDAEKNLAQFLRDRNIVIRVADNPEQAALLRAEIKGYLHRSNLILDAVPDIKALKGTPN